jgi:hypothetical protein
LVFSNKNVDFCVGTLAQWKLVERSGKKWEIGATWKSCRTNPGWYLTYPEGLAKGLGFRVTVVLIFPSVALLGLVY